MKARWTKTADGAQLSFGNRPPLAFVCLAQGGWDWWTRIDGTLREGGSMTMRGAQAAAEQAVRDALAEMAAAMEVRRG